MRYRNQRLLPAAALAALATVVFSSCETTPRITKVLPAYEPPLGKSDLQHVRTTAYTHTESDHREYGARNALGGELHAAGPAIRRAENKVRPVVTGSDQTFAYVSKARAAKAPKGKKPVKRAIAVKKPKIGSAAADWSRWPAGTTFRIVSTGQMYRVEDYGWALAGRNTIDLYMPDEHAMNSWGTREEPIQILHWGNPDDSLKLLMPRQRYKHVRRMVLELQGNEEEAAAMR